MGARIAHRRARALHDSNDWPLPLELSLAAILSASPCDLRCGGAAYGIALKDCSPMGANARASNGDRSCSIQGSRVLHSCTWRDFCWIGRRLVCVGIAGAPLETSTVGADRSHI